MFDASTPRARHGCHVVSAASVLGILVAVFLASQDLINVYGDGIAHLNIARKVVDEAPGTPLWSHYVQFGSPWLPVPHLLMLPFVWIDPLWRSGWAGTIPSLACYVAAVWLTYRIAFDLFSDAGAIRERSALLAAVTVGLNPSVLYIASTPMTEAPFLAVLAASAWTLLRWSRDGKLTSLALAGLCAAAATLTRYEGWALVPAGAAIVAVCGRGSRANRLREIGLWSLVASSGIAFWLWHNYAVAGDPLAFVRGPYSARAVFERASLGWAAVSAGRPLKSAGWALLAVAVVSGPAVVCLAVAGAVCRVANRGRALIADAPAALLAVPFAFLAFSLYRGEVQIAPFAAVALLNVRYGVPHVALAAILVAALAARFCRVRFFLPVLLAIVVASDVWLVSEGFSQVAVCQEAIRNSRNAPEWQHRAAVAKWLAANQPAGRTLLHSGDLGPVVSMSRLTFARVVHDGSPAWGEWVATGHLPADVTTVVARRDDEVMRRLATDPAFAAGFAQAFESGPFVVFTRN